MTARSRHAPTASGLFCPLRAASLTLRGGCPIVTHGIAPRHSFPAALFAFSRFARLWAPQLRYMLRRVVGLVASLCRSARFVVVATMAELFAQRGAASRSFFARLFAARFGYSLIFLYLCTRFVTETSSRQGRTRASANLNDSVAQLVEQVTLNHWVVSSSLTGVTRAGRYPTDGVPLCFCSSRRLAPFSLFSTSLSLLVGLLSLS